MDFFESQELARKKTKWLIFLFGLSVFAIVAAIFAVAVFVISMASKAEGNDVFAIATDWRLIASIVFGVLTVIGTGSATKMFALRSGGSAVASMMGGRRLVGNSKELTDRKVANVVEEMALAAGTPVPPVYILDNEEGINAFAAGYTVDDAVIGINRGTAEKLTREELQGVVAHEFSHILNGDMRMSLRMVAILNGILLISIIGGYMLRFVSYSGHSRSRSSSKDNEGGGKIVLLIIAVALYAIGSIGLFFGRLIKSTISRQREYLADASAVQFTRIPDGISGALKMIGGMSEQSHMQSGGAEEISHMFFGASQASLWFSTHPPLLHRIQTIDSKFDGDYQKFMTVRERRRKLLQSDNQKRDKKSEKEAKKKKLMDFLPGSEKFGMFEKMELPINPLILIAGIGIPTTEDVEYSGFMVDEIDDELLHAIRETFSARCVVFASLLSRESDVYAKQLNLIEQSEAKGTKEMTVTVKKLFDELPIHLRLGVFEIIQGTLSAMSPSQYPVFRKTVNDLIVADRQVDLFEFFLFHHLIVHLDRCFQSKPPSQNIYNNLEALKPEIGQMISILACVGQNSEQDQKTVFNAALESLFSKGNFDNLFIPKWKHNELSNALTKVSKATPLTKKKILSAAVLAISHDNVLTVQEVELFRAMSESLDCPVPPLVATHEKAPELPDPEDVGE